MAQLINISRPLTTIVLLRAIRRQKHAVLPEVSGRFLTILEQTKRHYSASNEKPAMYQNLDPASPALPQLLATPTTDNHDAPVDGILQQIFHFSSTYQAEATVQEPCCLSDLVLHFNPPLHFAESVEIP